MNISCWSYGGEQGCPLKGVAPSQLVSCSGKRPVWGMDWGRSMHGRGRRDIFLAPHLVHTHSSLCYRTAWSTSVGVGAVPCHRPMTLGRQGVCGEDLGLGPRCSFPESFSVTHSLLSSVQPVLHPIREGSTPMPGSQWSRETLDPSFEVRRWGLPRASWAESFEAPPLRGLLWGSHLTKVCLTSPFVNQKKHLPLRVAMRIREICVEWLEFIYSFTVYSCHPLLL